jgi:hypothetical protein
MFIAAMTTRGWTPGPGDPTLMGWVIFFGYLAVALLAWRAARLEASQGLDPFLWRALAVACVVLALNKQLDLHNAITAFGRQLARTEGWYRQRRTVQLGGLVCLALAGGAALAWVFRRTGSEWRRHRLTWAGLILLVIFMGMRAASFHHLDKVLRLELGGFRLHAVIEFVGICLLFLSARHAARYPAPPARGS